MITLIAPEGGKWNEEMERDEKYNFSYYVYCLVDIPKRMWRWSGL